jgi:hypothetical protein
VALAQFWDSLDRVFTQAEAGAEAEARTQIRLSLEARLAALSASVSRLLVQNNENEQESAARTREIYARVERNRIASSSALVVKMTYRYCMPPTNY